MDSGRPRTRALLYARCLSFTWLTAAAPHAPCSVVKPSWSVERKPSHAQPNLRRYFGAESLHRLARN